MASPSPVSALLLLLDSRWGFHNSMQFLVNLLQVQGCREAALLVFGGDFKPSTPSEGHREAVLILLGGDFKHRTPNEGHRETTLLLFGGADFKPSLPNEGRGEAKLL